MINASVDSTRYGLQNMPGTAVDRAYAYTILPDGCWESHYANKNPQILWKVVGEQYIMYQWRMVYYLMHSTVPDPYSIIRTCDNTRCVNPDHRRER